MPSDRRDTPKEETAAVRWARLAAEKGDADSQFNLGMAYDKGRGVPQDYAIAAKWYRLAADQGYALAQLSLGVMYQLGHGVPQDYLHAHMWTNLAAATLPGEPREQAEGARDAIARKMTRAQVAEAQKLARDWKPKPQPANAPQT